MADTLLQLLLGRPRGGSEGSRNGKVGGSEGTERKNFTKGGEGQITGFNYLRNDSSWGNDLALAPLETTAAGKVIKRWGGGGKTGREGRRGTAVRVTQREFPPSFRMLICG